MKPGGRRVLETLSVLAQFASSRRIVEERRYGTQRDAKHVGRVFALMARDDVRRAVGDTLAAIDGAIGGRVRWATDTNWH